MIPFFHEYRMDHPRFREHARVAFLMAMITPACAIFFLRALGWGNPWLWGSCGFGLALALCLYSVMLLHRRPTGISEFSQRLIARSHEWFPSFFCVIQSSIAGLIILFLWFNITSQAFVIPLYLHLLLVLLCLLLPVRRLLAARLAAHPTGRELLRKEIFRAIWHILMTIVVTRGIIAFTISDINDTSPENISWQVMLWVPASLYILFVLVLILDHLRKDRAALAPTADTPQNSPRPPEPVDRF